MVNYWLPNDLVLQRIFPYERIYYVQWCQRITRMGEWANTFEIFVFLYFMKITLIGIDNYLGNFSTNNMHTYAQQLRLLDTFLDKPAIHMYLHKYGHPLEMNNSGNHFAYLKPISVIMYDSLDNGIPIQLRKVASFLCPLFLDGHICPQCKQQPHDQQ